MRAKPRITAAVLASLSLSGCLFYPKMEPRTTREQECEMVTRKWTLEAAVDGSVPPCSGQDGAECLAIIGAVALVSGAVSGSVVLVGNTLYWLEKQGRCPESHLEAARESHVESRMKQGGQLISGDVNPVTAGELDQD